MNITIDTNIIIWGIKKEASQGQDNLISHAERFLKWADENKHTIVVPSIVVAEILAPLDIEKEAEMMRILTQMFVIAPMDSNVCRIYATLLRNKFSDLKQVAKENGIRREKMKFDHIVVATALSHGCTKIVSNDPDVRRFAQGTINVSKLEDSFNIPGEQQTLDIFS